MIGQLKLPEHQRQTLLEAIQRFPRYRILVVGDLILDVFIWGKVSRISPEAPVPVVEVVEETRLLGGAANVVHNLAALGGRVLVAGLIGEDASGQRLSVLLQQLSIPTDGLIVEHQRPTTIKTRIIAHSQQVVRFDREWRDPPETHSRDRIRSYIGESMGQIDGVVISDYGKGVITLELMDEIRAMTSARHLPVMVDPKIHNMSLYQQVTMVTPNSHEASMMAGIDIRDADTLLAAGNRLLDLLKCRMVLITRGEAGMSLFQQGAKVKHIPTVARRVYDVTGAGDTVISTIMLGMLAGLPVADAALLANIAAGVVVGEVGTATVSAARLTDAIQNGI
jgi:D-beta-D-heptose 7-phosphate kinase/D-beta-D-heptose 1-phosphate adenosyltransferase